MSVTMFACWIAGFYRRKCTFLESESTTLLARGGGDFRILLGVLELSVLSSHDSLGLGGGGVVVADPERAGRGPNTVSGAEGVALDGEGEFLHGDEAGLGTEGGPEVAQEHDVVEALDQLGWRPGGLSPVSSSGE